MEHKTKYKQLTEAYLHALGVITESTATWAAFLSSAAYTYEERFQSQVLLHHQRPGIKAVATLNQWDREKNRHIIRGSHGIPVFDAKHPECLTYVFDYQDTAGRSTPGLFPWTVYESKSGIARHNLLRRSGEKSLDSYVHTKVQQIVDTEVKSETSAAMRAELQKFLEQSAKYVVYTRLNMPVDDLDTSSFSFATQYQNRPKVLERLGTLLSHSLVACLSPVRDIAQAMHMTMPPPEELAVQKKDTKTRSVPETSKVTAESSPEAPREWGFYVIPDLKTWATNSSERTPIEHYETFEEARDRFASLRDQPYNKTNDLNDDGQPYAHLTLGLESKDKLSSVDILQVRAGQNYLVEDFTRMERLRADSVVLENLSRVAREIGFDRVRPYVMENGSYKALPDMPFSQWENPYFTVDSPEQGDTFTIYQLKGGSETRDYRFEPYESLQEAGLAIDRQNYDLVYTAPLDGKTTLEDIFRTFNLDRPPDFTGHSLSVSDIVVLHQNDEDTAHYVDSIGFQQVPEFLQEQQTPVFDKLPPEQQQALSDTVQDTLQMLVDADKRIYGDVTGKTLEAIAAQGYSYKDGQLEKQQPEATPDSLLTGETVRTPRGNFHITDMSREQIEAAGFGFHHASEDGKYLIMGNGTQAYAIAAEQPQRDNPLKHVEDIVEQNDNNFDGIINNTPTVDELEAKVKAGEQISLAEYAEALKIDKERGKTAKQEKPSIWAQLKAAKEQTPKKQTRQKTQDLERS